MSIESPSLASFDICVDLHAFGGFVCFFPLKELVFYERKPPHGQKTSWILHEFDPREDDGSEEDTSMGVCT